jgi:arabinoxylan arabinofuranohydrolase
VNVHLEGAMGQAEEDFRVLNAFSRDLGHERVPSTADHRWRGYLARFRLARRWLVTAALGIVLLVVTDARAQNPIIDQGSADPSVKVFGGRAYIYGSHDFSPSNTTWIMKDWKVFSSADLVTWTDHGVVLDDDSLAWRGVTDRDFAPDAIFFNNQYYFYFPLGDGTIGVASGASAAGPFTDILGKALVDSSTAPIFNIDPMAFEDTDGSRYLIWGNGGCYIAQLNDDMKSFKTAPQRITISGSAGYAEGPFAWMYGGQYYLLYSRCGSVCSDTLDYGVASSLKGPYTYKGSIIGHCKSGNEHGSVFQFNGQWYVAYHDLYPTDFYRKTKLEFIHYTNSGDIPRVYPTDYGVGRYDGSNQIEAENFFDKSTGITYEDCTDAGNGFDVTAITSDSWLKFQNVDLGAGASWFQARVSASTGAHSIEIRLGSVDGTLIGTCDVTAGDETWTTVVAGLSTTVTGVNDVFLVFRGGSGNLFKLNWIRFVSPIDGGAESIDSSRVGANSSCSIATEASGCSCNLGGHSGPASIGVPLCILCVLGLLWRRRILPKRVRTSKWLG